MSVLPRIASNENRTPPSCGSSSTVGRTRRPRTTAPARSRSPCTGERRSSTIVFASAAARPHLRRRAHQVAVRDQHVVGQHLLRGAQHERRLAIAPRREDDDVLSVSHVGGQRGDLGRPVRERLVLGQVAEGERVRDDTQACIMHYCVTQRGILRRRIRFAYGYAPAGRILRGGRATIVLAGRGAARRDAACRLAAGPRPREATRDAAPRPLGPARRADGVRPAALPRRPEAAHARGAAPRRRRLRGDRRSRRLAVARRVDRAGGDRGAAASLRVPAIAPGGPDRARGARHAHRRRARRRPAARARDRRGDAEAPRGPLRAVRRGRGRARLSTRSPLRGTLARGRRARDRDADRHAGRRRGASCRRGRAPAPRRPPARPRRTARARVAGVRAERRPRRLRRDVHLAHRGRGRARGRHARGGACRGHGRAPGDLDRGRHGPGAATRRAGVRGVRARAGRAPSRTRLRPRAARRA